MVRYFVISKGENLLKLQMTGGYIIRVRLHNCLFYRTDFICISIFFFFLACRLFEVQGMYMDVTLLTNTIFAKDI